MSKHAIAFEMTAVGVQVICHVMTIYNSHSLMNNDRFKILCNGELMKTIFKSVMLTMVWIIPLLDGFARMQKKLNLLQSMRLTFIIALLITVALVTFEKYFIMKNVKQVVVVIKMKVVVIKMKVLLENTLTMR